MSKAIVARGVFEDSFFSSALYEHSGDPAAMVVRAPNAPPAARGSFSTLRPGPSSTLDQAAPTPPSSKSAQKAASRCAAQKVASLAPGEPSSGVEASSAAASSMREL